MDAARPILFLLISNLFMTYAWYGHLKDLKSSPLWMAVLLSWSVAFFEYCFQVPANRMGSQYYTVGQLKIIQEVMTMVVFSGFAVFYLNVPISKNFMYAGFCMIGAVYFMFRDGITVP